MRYVAFLRAINVGNRRIKMADLRDVYTDLGYENIATYIASGNIVFDSPRPPKISDLEDAFEHAFGFSAEVFLRDEQQVTDLVERVPWRTDAGIVEVSFLERSPNASDARALEGTAIAPERIVVTDTEVLFLRRGKGMDTIHKESTAMEILDMKMTRRGLATVQQIAERFLTQQPGSVAP